MDKFENDRSFLIDFYTRLRDSHIDTSTDFVARTLLKIIADHDTIPDLIRILDDTVKTQELVTQNVAALGMDFFTISDTCLRSSMFQALHLYLQRYV